MGSINSFLLDLHAHAIQFLIGAMVLVFESWPQKFTNFYKNVWLMTSLVMQDDIVTIETHSNK